MFAITCGMSAVHRVVLMRQRSLGALASTCGMSAVHRIVLPTRPRHAASYFRVPRVHSFAETTRGASSSASSSAFCTQGESDSPVESRLSRNPDLDYSLPYRVLAFYVITPVAAAESLIKVHRRFLEERQMVGRVYLSADGINAQVSGTVRSCHEYREFILVAFPSTELIFKEDPVSEPAFPKLRTKVKKLVPGGGDLDFSDRGQDLSPEEWATMLDEQVQSGVVAVPLHPYLLLIVCPTGGRPAYRNILVSS